MSGNVENLKRFVQAAHTGAYSGASRGEKIANKLAVAMDKLGDEAALLDYDAIEGACEMLRAMTAPLQTELAKKYLLDWVHYATKGGNQPIGLAITAVNGVENFKRFVRIANKGVHGGCSHGEAVANKLAAMMHKLGDDLALLDEPTIDGVCTMLHAISGPWATEIAKENVFGWLSYSAKKRAKTPVRKGVKG